MASTGWKKFTLAALIIAGVATAFWLARPVYRDWKQRRFLSQARTAWVMGDMKNASFSARKTLEINPANVEACRLMAQISEQIKSSQAVAWRARVVELQPVPASNRLELARAALLFGNGAEANRALLGIDEADRHTADYHTLSAMLALARNDFAAAEEYCAKAATLDPQNKLTLLNLAVLRVQSTDSLIRDDAIKQLEDLADDPNQGRDALRTLVAAALKDKNFSNAQRYSRRLLVETNAPFGDRLLHLTILKQSGSAELSSYLASLETLSAQDPQQLDALGEWLRANRMSGEAIDWLLHLPEVIRSNRAATQLLAECYADRLEWNKLEELLQNQKWNDMDFLRLAQLAHARKELNQRLSSQSDWRAAIAAASGKLKPLSILLEMAAAWNWQTEREEIAWRIVQDFPSERRVLKLLEQLYLESQNTPGLHKVYAAMMKYQSPDTVTKNNFAAVSLLLNRQVPEAVELARKNFEDHPDDPILASTHAYALHLRGQTKQGLALLEKLKPEYQRHPGVAAYYGVLLAAAGQTNKAAEYLQIASTSGHLLPEEKTLIASALGATNPGH